MEFSRRGLSAMLVAHIEDTPILDLLRRTFIPPSGSRRWIFHWLGGFDCLDMLCCERVPAHLPQGILEIPAS